MRKGWLVIVLLLLLALCAGSVLFFLWEEETFEESFDGVVSGADVGVVLYQPLSNLVSRLLRPLAGSAQEREHDECQMTLKFRARLLELYLLWVDVGAIKHL